MTMPISFRLSAVALAASFLLAPHALHAQSSAASPRYEDIYGHPLPPQKHVRVYGQNIAYYDIGHSASDQPVLVLLHGYGSQADVDFGPSLPLLANHRRVIALDQIGAGNSDKPYIEYHVQTYVEWLAEFLRTLGITRFDLLGESLGGWTAAAYAEQACAADSKLPKPMRLILEDAAGFEASTAPLPPLHMTVSTEGETITGLRSVFYDPSLVTPEVAKRRFISKLAANDAFAAATFSTNPAVRNEAVGTKANTISLPTLVVWGAEDHTVPVTFAHSYANAISAAKLVLIDRSGHLPSLEQPGPFVDAVETFLAK
jgi:pimeloyl-ACP methyl ester carboxylesterase